MEIRPDPNHKDRQCKTSTGKSKAAYQTSSQARQVRKSMAKAGLHVMVYQCQECGMYHLGHSTTQQERPL